MRVAFAGTPAFAAGALSAVLDAGHELPLVLTQPDRPAGRGMKLQASEVKQAALARGLSVLQPRSLKLDGRWPDDARQARAALLQAAADVLVVAAYGLILPPWTLELPRHGCLNIHASLLPRWRGAAPIQRAVQAGDTQTGITIMQMDAGLDTGDILLCRPVPISAQDTAGSLHDRLAAIGAEQIVAALHRLALGELTPTPQPAQGVTIAPKIAKAEAAIDWSRPAPWIERTVRAFDPFPGAHFSCQGQVIKLWRAATDELAARAALAAPGTVVARTGEALWVACGEGVLRLTQLQAPGGKRLPAAAFLGSPLGRTLVEGVQL